MTSRSKIVLAASIVASCSSSLEPKCANSPLLLIPTAPARRASDSPSSPSTVASRAASRRIAARLRSPSDRWRRDGPVPSPAFRSTSLGIMLSVVFVRAAALTLLPAVLAKLGPRVDRFALPWVHAREHHSPRSAAWGERLWRHPRRYGLGALALLVVLALPVFS